MIHDQLDVDLSQMIQGPSLGNDPADESVVVFDGRFLIGSLRVTIEDP